MRIPAKVVVVIVVVVVPLNVGAFPERSKADFNIYYLANVYHLPACPFPNSIRRGTKTWHSAEAAFRLQANLIQIKFTLNCLGLTAHTVFNKCSRGIGLCSDWAALSHVRSYHWDRQQHLLQYKP